PEARDFLYNNWQEGKAVVTPRWKIVTPRDDGEWELYDMNSDITETENLSDEHPDVVSRLDSLYEDWMSNMPE
ncbi:MAG: hypothetical protein R6U46_07305, partial [Marinilabilia sp.]